MVTIREAKTWYDREVFIRLSEKIHRDFPAYCVPVFAEQRKFISRSHPFLAHGDAALFLAYNGNEPIGRAMVSFDPRYKELHRVSVSHVGLFESINDAAVSQSLLQRCAEWAKEKHGASLLRGPVDYSLNYPIGMYLGPYDAPQRILMNYNPPYYPALWEAFGFRKALDFYSWWGKTPDHIDRWVEKVRRIGSHSTVTIRHLTKKSFKKDLMRTKDFIALILLGNSGYVPMTELEHKHFVKDLQFVPPEFIWIAEDEGKIVGLSLTLPDFNEAIRPLKGKLFPFGLPTGIWKFYNGLKKIKTARVGLLGVHPDYRFQGIPERMIIETLMVGREKFKFEAAEIGWTFEDNVAMINNIDKMGTELKKSYRIYEKQLC